MALREMKALGLEPKTYGLNHALRERFFSAAPAFRGGCYVFSFVRGENVIREHCRLAEMPVFFCTSDKPALTSKEPFGESLHRRVWR
jgi:hypothetical protein